VRTALVPEEVRRRGAAADELDVDVLVSDEDVAELEALLSRLQKGKRRKP